MSRELVGESAGVPAGPLLGYLEREPGAPWAAPAARSRTLRRDWSRHWRLLAFVALGGAAAAAVGYLTAQNPDAMPAHAGVYIRVSIILSLVGAGAYAQTNTGQARMGMLLVAAGLVCSLWLLNGSREPLLFSVGMLFTGVAPAVFALLVLAFPSGRLQGDAERRLLLLAGGSALLLWTFVALTTPAPPVRTPLLDCVNGCPHNVLSFASAGSGLESVARAGLWLSWAALVLGVPALLARRIRRGTQPLRRSLVPVAVAACFTASLWVAFAVARIAGSQAASGIGAAYVETAVLVPLAILAGLFVERLAMGRALATFVSGLVEHPGVTPEALLARALDDPSVEIAYLEPPTGIHADTRDRLAKVADNGDQRAVALIERHGSPIAAVSYDAALSDQAAFVQAAGAVALMHVEAARLAADLTESNRELAASRLRLMEAANSERQRIERDLHDGVQQHIVGLRLRLDLAAEEIRDDPDRGAQMIGAIGRQVDELLGALRSFAAGIYPAVLTERGLKDALESAVRTASIPVSLHTSALRRYPEDVEVAVYFCCLEAIQNVAKHAGPDAEVGMRVWQIGDALAFEVRDTGLGFDASRTPAGHGLTNMRDRIEAVGGTLGVSSKRGHGTWVRGRVPLG
jgi:signal transduction histidine kinase